MSLAVIGTVAAVAGAAATVGSAVYNDVNAGSAGQTATNAQLTATQQQQANFNLIESQEAPYQAVGSSAAPEVTSMLNGGYNMTQSPAAQYAMEQGSKTVNTNEQARGLEGNAVQQLGQLSSSTAASDYQTRFQDLLAATNVGSAGVAMTTSGANNLNSNLQTGAQNLGSIATNTANTQAGIAGGAAGNLNGLGSGLTNLAALGSGNSGSMAVPISTPTVSYGDSSGNSYSGIGSVTQ